MTRRSPALLLLSLVVVAGAAQAQSQNQNIWKWRDTNGVMQISDQPPPNSVPLKDIVSRPDASSRRSAPVVAAAPDVAPDAAAAASAPVRVDNELEARKKKQQADKAAAADERKQADKARMDGLKAENCKRAKAQLAMLESGVRVTRPNEKGEREFLDDKARAEETNRARSAVDDTCQ